MVSGYGSNILFFEDLGAKFILVHNLTTPEPFFLNVQGSKDFSVIPVGGFAQTAMTYKLVNGTYEQILSEFIGGSIYSTTTDSRGLYSIFCIGFGAIELYFSCPEECLTCTFPTNCTECSEGYVLKGGTCVEKPTHCVQNKFQFNNVCQEYCHKKCKTCNQTRTDCY